MSSAFEAAYLEDPKLRWLRCPSCGTKLKKLDLSKCATGVNGIVYFCSNCTAAYGKAFIAAEYMKILNELQK